MIVALQQYLDEKLKLKKLNSLNVNVIHQRMQDSSSSYTYGQWLTLIAIGSVHFSSSICISLQAPFYPQEAEKKNATATEYGLVFGSFELTAFLSSPLFGHYIDSVGTNLLLNLGMMVNAITSILFGFLDYVNTHDEFVILSFVLRILESLGATAALIAAFSLTAASFPNSVATVFATLEVFYGLGYIVGPTIGGFLFSVGGFKLPFFVIGIASMIIAVIVSVFIPPVQSTYTESENQPKMSKVLRIPAVFLDSLSICAASSSMGFYTAVLEPHLREFNISSVAVGFMFIISGGTYACTAPFVGRICDKWAHPRKVLIVGCILIITSFVIVGPFPMSGIPKSLNMCILGLVVHGLGLSCIMVPTFIDALRSAIDAGYPDDLSTYGILSGLWSSSFALGAFVGPSVAGFLYDYVGFQYGSLFVIVTHFLLLIVLLIFVYSKKSTRSQYKQVSEETKLLSQQKYNHQNGRKPNGTGAVIYNKNKYPYEYTRIFGSDPRFPQTGSQTNLMLRNPQFSNLMPRMPRRLSMGRSKSESHSGPSYSGYDCI